MRLSSQVHFPGVFCTESRSWSCQERRWLQAGQAAHLPCQSVHRLWQVCCP